MVDRVETPEGGAPVKGAVYRVLGEIGHEHDLEELEEDRLATDRRCRPSG